MLKVNDKGNANKGCLRPFFGELEKLIEENKADWIHRDDLKNCKTTPDLSLAYGETATEKIYWFIKK